MTILASPVPTAELTPVTFTVFGDPIPQGSMKTVRGRDGKVRVVSDNPRLEPWRNAITAKAKEAWHAHAGRRTPIYGPVRLDLVFAVRQRASAPKSWRDRPNWSAPTGQRTGDIDKIIRGCLDALTAAQVYRDDSQVVEIAASQHYAGAHGCPLATPGAQITISEVVR